MSFLSAPPCRLFAAIALSFLAVGLAPVWALAEISENPGPSSRRTSLAITEIHSRPAARSDGRVIEFVELYNAEPIPCRLGGFRLEGAGISYTFPEGTTLAARSYLVVARVPADVTAVYGTTGVLGPWTGSLSPAAGELRLEHRLGALLLEAKYVVRRDRAIAADGVGHSLVLARPSLGEKDPEAWSASRLPGGSPGAAEPSLSSGEAAVSAVAINEVLGNPGTPGSGFVELYNPGAAAVALSGCELRSGVGGTPYVFPAGASLPARGFIIVSESTLGFTLDSALEGIFLHSAGGRVIDALRFDGQQVGVAYGRSGNGAPRIYPLATATPGAANAAPLRSAVVINEIMYHPISGSDADAYVELHNRSAAAVDIGGWRIVDGIQFTFPVGTSVPAGGYLVVAKDRQRLLSRYPGLAPTVVLGNYSGNLSRSGERIALACPAVSTSGATGLAVVDEVAYADGGRWAGAADGEGSSLELIDARADGRLGANWAASDESAKSQWTSLSSSSESVSGKGASNRLDVVMNGSGECLVRFVRVTLNSTNLSNGSWSATGNHSVSAGPESTIRITATGGGDTGPNAAHLILSGSQASNGNNVQIVAEARWISGKGNPIFRLQGNYLELASPLSIPTNLGTPGAANSQASAVRGPAIFDVAHAPVLPAASQAVTVTARLSDPDGIAAPVLRYNSTTVAMNDAGNNGDAVAGDGIYSGLIPGHASGVVVPFSVQASDGAGAAARFPADAAANCLVRFGETTSAGAFGSYRMWMTASTLSAWENGLRLSDATHDVTFVLDDQRVIYNARARYRGSPFVRPGYTSPRSGDVTPFVIKLPGDSHFLGGEELNLDGLEQPSRDPTLQAERTCFWLAEQLGVSFSYQRYVRMMVNGAQRGEVFADTQQVDSDYIDSWFPGGEDGDFHKVDDWFEFDTGSYDNFSGYETANLSVEQNGGILTKQRYRWNWERRKVNAADDDYSALLSLSETLSGKTEASIEQIVDVDRFARVLASRRIVGDWDSYGWDRGKNMSVYKPPGGRWALLPWDIDQTFNTAGRDPNSSLLSSHDPAITRLLSFPKFYRLYLRALSEAANGAMQDAAVRAVMEPVRAAFQSNGVTAASPNDILSWIAQRRAYILAQTANANAAFAITTNGGGAVTTTGNHIVIEGTGPLGMDAILLDGTTRQVTWIDEKTWRIAVILQPGQQTLGFAPLDSKGQAIAPVATVTATAGASLDPAAGSLVISEIMYRPAVANAEFVEITNRSSSTAFDLTGWRLRGIDYDFAAGSAILPGESLVVARDETAFASAYGAGIRVLGLYAGVLSPEGENLQLVRKAAGSEPELVACEVFYSPAQPWPALANGEGASLQLVDASRDIRRAGNWTAAFAQPVYRPGVIGRYWSNTSFSGAPALVRQDASIDFEWRSNVATDLPRNNLSVEWSGMLFPEFTGTYSLLTYSDDGFELRLNTDSVISRLVQQSATTHTATRAMTAAPERMRGRFFKSGSGVAAARVSWQPPSAPPAVVPTGYVNGAGRRVGLFTDSGLRAQYWNNMTLSGNPALERVDLSVDFLWGSGSPSSSVNVDGFSARWTGVVVPAAAGNYTFYVSSDDGVRLWVNGVLLIDEWVNRGTTENSASILLPAGQPADIRLEYFENTGDAEVRFSWSGPSLAKEIVPAGYTTADGGETGAFHRVGRAATPGTANAFTQALSEFPALWLNEIQPVNTNGLTDSSGQRHPWIEIHNAGATAASLDGVFLSNAYDDLRRWAFPSGTIVPARGFLIVFLDGRPGISTSAEPHTSFALDPVAGGIALSRAMGDGSQLIDYLNYATDASNVAYGSFPEDTKRETVRLDPTPRAANRLQTATITELLMPRYMQGASPNNAQRVPFAYRARIDGLLPNATYRYGNRVVTLDDPVTQDGAGHTIFVKTDGSAFVRTTDSPRFQTADLDLRHATFTTNAEGSFTGWFITIPSGNARFASGGTVFMRILLNNGQGGTDVATTLTAPSGVEVLDFSTAGLAVRGEAVSPAKNFLLLYDNRAGAGRPLAAVPIEGTGATIDSNYAAFYRLNVAGQNGKWGALAPAGLTQGIRRVEERALSDGRVLTATVFLDGAKGTVASAAGAAGLRIDLQTSFSAWVRGKMPIESLTDPAQAGVTADPDGDGRPNLLEYALGSDPQRVDVQDGAVLEFVGNHASLVFPRDATLSEIAYRVTATNDLGSWPETLFDSRIDNRANNEGSKLRIVDPVSVDDVSFQRRFLRLEVLEIP